ncbi:MAG: DUF1330 domain-containing protein [Cognatishimia sp.]
MPALWISHVDVTDPEAYAEYAKRAVPVIESMGGVFVARGAEFATLEGHAWQRHTIVRFSDLATAQACYDSPAYQHAVGFANGASKRSLTLIEVVDT